MQVPDWHPGTPASNQEIFNQDTWQVNMENFFSELVTTYPGVVGKLILDLVNVRHSSSSSPHVSWLISLQCVCHGVPGLLLPQFLLFLLKLSLLMLFGCILGMSEVHRLFSSLKILLFVHHERTCNVCLHAKRLMVLCTLKGCNW